jgi:hypothetical protein
MFTPDTVQAIWRWSSGIPRVVNLLCDRALEAACARQLHTIDADLVDTAAIALDLRAEPLAEPTPPASPSVDTHVTPIPPSVDVTPIPPNADVTPIPPSADVTPIPPSADVTPIPPSADVTPIPPSADVTPIPPSADVTPIPPSFDVTLIQPSFETAMASARARKKRIAQLIAVLAVVVVAVAWFVTRAPATAVTGSRVATAGGGAAPPGVPASVPSTPAASLAPASVPPPPASPPPASAAPERASAPPAATAPDAIVPSFEIIVASFRTEARAVSVAAQVSDAGLKVRRRTIAGWQQVIAGPFVSREEADAAHQRLERAGLPGTQIVSPNVEPRE